MQAPMRDDATLAEYDRKFDQRRFPAGRTIQALKPIEPLARHHGYDDLADLVEQAIATAMRYIELKARRSAQSMARGGGLTRAYDAKVDSNFGQIYGLLVREAKDYAGEPSGKLAQAMLDHCFPKGLAHVVSIPYEEQVALNEYLVIVMRRDHGQAIDELGLHRYVRRIEQLLPGYRASMDTSDAVTAVDLGRAWEAMQVGLLRVIAWVMAMVHDAERRAELLAGVHDQEARLAAIHAARRRGSSVGDDVPFDELELDAEAQAALAAEARAAEVADEASQAAAEGSDEAADGVDRGADRDGPATLDELPAVQPLPRP